MNDNGTGYSYTMNHIFIPTFINSRLSGYLKQARKKKEK